MTSGRVYVAQAIEQAHESCNDTKPSNDGTMSEGAAIGLSLSAAPLAHALSASRIARPEVGARTDWTRHAIPNMSPWIKFLRDFDWVDTALGPLESWPNILRTYALQIMINPNPRLIMWGDDKTFLYNEAFAGLIDEKHPLSLGKPGLHHWSELWEWLSPILDACFQGTVDTRPAQRLFINRKGFLEETFWDYTMLPIFDEHGAVVGILDEVSEVTDGQTAARRREALARASASMSSSATFSDLWRDCQTILEECAIDVPLALIYTVTDHDGGAPSNPSTEVDGQGGSAKHDSGQSQKLSLFATVGISPDHASAVKAHPLEAGQDADRLAQIIATAYQRREPIMLNASNGSLPALLEGIATERSLGDPIKDFLVSPIRSTMDARVYGVIIVGLNPRCNYNDEYQVYLRFTMDFISKGATMISLPEEQLRAQAAADDAANALVKQLQIQTLAVEQSEAKFSRWAASSPIGMFMFDTHGQPLYVNDAYLRITGLSSERRKVKQSELLRWENQVMAADLDRFLTAWQSLIDDHLPITIEYRSNAAHDDMPETWLLATAFPELNDNGQLQAVIGWLTDISRQKQADKVLTQQLADVIEQKRQTENFIDMTSHEMRNPLSAILHSADEILSGMPAHRSNLDTSGVKISQETRDGIVNAADTILLCAQHQKQIVDDILTLSKLDANLLSLTPEKVQPQTLVRKALQMFNADLRRADLQAHVCLDKSYTELGVDFLILDPDRFVQVIINLITNAIKFTRDAAVRNIKICLGASRQKPSGGCNNVRYLPSRSVDQNVLLTPTPPPTDGLEQDIYVTVAVHDTGKGLTSQEMERLFERFHQASPKTYSGYGGSGLGLFISRLLCEMQGGQIGVASSNAGTVFAFFVKAKRGVTDVADGVSNVAQEYDVPARTVPELSSQLDDASLVPLHANGDQRPTLHKRLSDDVESLPALLGVPDLHVLIVEDNLINQKVLARQLRRAGCIVHVADHGGKCLEFLDRSTFRVGAGGGGVPLSLILLDLEMPVMGGLACIRQIRAQEACQTLAPHVPVIAVTANARPEHVANALDAGMDRVVTKPFRLPVLVTQVQQLFSTIHEGGRQQLLPEISGLA